MAKNNSSNQDFTNNADGFDVTGGVTRRKLTATGADITLTGSGTNVYTFPSATDTLVGRASTDTLTNKILTSPTLGGTVAGTYTLGGTPTFPATVVLTTGAQTLASKTLTTPIISSISNTGTLTLPTSTDTLVGRATTDTLTNKTIDGSQLVAASVPSSKLKLGLIKSRQGGTTGAASWSTAGTSNTDVSATDVFMQTGNIAVTSGNQTVTFGVAYNQVPNVIASVSSANSVNGWAEVVGVTTTTCTLRVWSAAGAAATTETVSWISIGQ